MTEASMKRWWVSWYGDNGVFELYSPWWISGSRCEDDVWIFVAAVRAESEAGARRVIEAAHDEGRSPKEWRFVEERPADWSPFNGRFERASWMVWPEEPEGDAS